ncbi:uncharacterized protein [Hoplias malabaricus]|uniref:uncharacterized protein n=1 Tax=Hoplias malabaricus TaxID=27720 RepID=UPI003462AC29
MLRPHLIFILVVSAVGETWLADAINMRLANGNGVCYGRVEVYHNGQWGTVCDDSWDMNDAAVVCRQMGCGQAISAPHSARFGQGSGPIFLDDVGCSGSESSITSCSHRGFNIHDCSHGEDASVVCSGNIRLVNGTSYCSGRVEVYHNDQWETVCDDNWDINDAAVVCRQMGCGRAISAPHGAHFGQGSGQILLDEVGCSGSEKSITACSNIGINKHDCSHGEDASVACSATLPTPRISFYPSREVTWGEKVTISCSVETQFTGGSFSLIKSSGSFRETKSGTSVTFSLTKVDFVHEGSYYCQYQTRVSTRDFSSQSSSVSFSVVVTLPTPRISLHSSREVTWGEKVDISCSVETQFTGGSFSLIKSSGSFRETKSGTSVTFSLTKVDFVHEGSYYCQYQTRVSSRDSSSPQSSSVRFSVVVTLPTPRISLHSSREVTWGEKVDISCSVETKFTGGSFSLIKSSGSFRETKSGTSVTFSLTKVDFVHEGSYYCQYQTRVSSRDFSSPQSSSVRFSVVVNLLQPNISFSSSPDGDFHWWLQSSEMTRGHSFSIICFTEPQYPGGSFHLEFSGSSITRTQSAVNHSASFFFPEANFTHQGNYSCVYEVAVSTRTFTSSSTPLLSVTVKTSPVPIIASGVSAGLFLILVPIIIYFIKRSKKQEVHQMDVKMDPRHRDKNTYETTGGMYETDDEDDYENAEAIFHHGEDSDGSEEDYINVNADKVNKAMKKNKAGAVRYWIENAADETDNEDDYENQEATVHQEEDSDNDDYVDIDAEAEKTVENNEYEDEQIYSNV